MLPEIESKIYAIKLIGRKKGVVGEREQKVIINYNYFQISTTAACWAVFYCGLNPVKCDVSDSQLLSHV